MIEGSAQLHGPEGVQYQLPAVFPGHVTPGCYATAFKCTGRPSEQISTDTTRLTIKAARDLDKLRARAQEARNNGVKREKEWPLTIWPKSEWFLK